MAMMAAILGGVPLILGHGIGSEFRQPLGYAVVGGLLISQILTLFATPVIHLALDALSERFRSSKIQIDKSTAYDVQPAE
jgi:HAE1 family hydrophobic/amphiphilic exporter-1